MSSKTERRHLLISDLFGGFVSGVCCKVVEHPFDTIKVLMQTVYKNSFDCLKKTVSMFGFRGLFRGIQFPLIGSIAENALTFLSYDYCKRLVGVTDPNKMTLMQMMLASMGSGFSISFLITPVELLKCRLQIEQSYSDTLNQVKRKKSTTVSVVRDLFKTDGLRGLFRGLDMTLLREIPGTSICYELSLKPFIHYGYSRESMPGGAIITAGSMSGAVYWAFIYPVDTIKSIIQTDVEYAKKVNGQGLTQLRLLAKYIYSVSKHYGFKGLYGGLAFTLLRAAPSNAVLFVTYEYACRFISQFF